MKGSEADLVSESDDLFSQVSFAALWMMPHYFVFLLCSGMPEGMQEGIYRT